MDLRIRTGPLLFLAVIVIATGCRRPERQSPGDKEAPAADREPPPPDRAELPGERGPFVEPPLEERPASTYTVALGCCTELGDAGEMLRRAAALEAVPVGYPALEQGEGGCRWRAVAGKFARRLWAQKLAEALRAGGLERAAVFERPYRHDRFTPSFNPDESRPAAGMVFAGLAGEKVPLLEAASLSSGSAGAELEDGGWVQVLERLEDEPGGWYKVAAAGRQGFLPASRLLCGHNLFPSPDGKRGVLQIPLGCAGGECRADWWLVGREYAERRLLAAAEEHMAHAFGPDGALAWAVAGRPLMLLREGREISLGDGTSPSWTSDGSRLYFRRPASAGARDEIILAEAPDWRARTLFDYPGKPFYPKRLSAHPPPVDVSSADGRLYTMFLRLMEKDGGMMLARWKVILDAQGKLLDKKAEQLTE